VFWLVFAACFGGKDLCERVEQADEDCGVPHPPDQTQACKKELRECSRKGRNAFDDYAKCYEKAGGFSCAPTDEERIAVLDCLTELDDLPEDCTVPFNAL
jgi:hypothetical protein